MNKFYWNKGIRVGIANTISLDKIPNARNSISDYKDNQGNTSECVIRAWVGCITDNYWKYIDWFLEKAREKAPQYGFEEWEGMYMEEWAKLCRDIWNEIKPDDPVITYEINMHDREKVDKILDKGYSIHIWYWGNQMYNADKRDDCCINEGDFKDATYYHSVRWTLSGLVKKCDGDIFVRDNYSGRPCNDYWVKNLQKLIENDVFFDNGYIYIFKNDIMPEYITQENATTSNRAWIIWAWENEVNSEERNFSVYNTDETPWTENYKLDEGDIIAKMLIDINTARNA